MTNKFNLVLEISTLIIGCLWCLDKFISYQRGHDRYEIIHKSIDGKLVDIKSKNRKSKLKMVWLKTTVSVFPTLAIVLVIRSFIYEPFKIPSESMMPTLLVGDFILVEKFSYGFKDLFFQKTLIKTGHPKRGDIIVFKYPNDPHLDYVKRAIGLPGDRIIYDPIEKEITIQPNFCSSYKKNTLSVTYSNVKTSNFIQTFAFHQNKENRSFFSSFKKCDEIKKNCILLMEREETLGGKTHRILTLPTAQDQFETYYQQPGQKLATWIVTPGQYFVMGDNRDNSADSRYWGFVPEENIIGKAVMIWMSFEKKEGQWPTGIRLNRIGKLH